MKPAALLTSVLLIAIAALHLARLLFAVEATVGGITIPMWPSVFAVIVPVGLAVGLWREGAQRLVSPGRTAGRRP